MSYSVVVRFDRASSVSVSREAIDGLLARLPSAATGTTSPYVVAASGTRVEVYFAWLTPEGDATREGEEGRFNAIECVASGPRPGLFRVAFLLADALKFGVDDPQRGATIFTPVSMGARFSHEAPLRTRVRRVIDARKKMYFSSLAVVDENTLAVGMKARFVRHPQCVELRALDTLGVLTTESALALRVALSPDGTMLLAEAPRYDEDARIAVVDPRTLRLERHVPLRGRFAWLRDWEDAFVAPTRYAKEGLAQSRPRETLTGDVARLSSGPTRLVVVDARNGRLQPFAAERLLGETFYGGGQVAISACGEVALFASQEVVHGFSLETGKLLWRTPLGGKVETRVRSIDAFAASPTLPLAAAGGLFGQGYGHHQLVVLDTRTGDVLLALGEALGDSSPKAMAFHPSGWLAVGMANGTVHHVALDGAIRSYVGIGAGVNSLAFAEGDTVLVVAGGHELAVWPLADDEKQPAVAPPVRASSKARQAAIDSWDHASSPFTPLEDPADIAFDGWITNDERVELLVARARRDRASLLQFIRSVATTNPHRMMYPLVALARLARERGEVFAPELFPLVQKLAHTIALTRYAAYLREILAALPEDRRDDAALADTSEPIWVRFHATDSDRALRVLVTLVAGYEKGVYTRLSKARIPDFASKNGHSAREFHSRAVEAIARFGQRAVPVIEEALLAKPALSKVLRDALAEIHGAA